MTAEANESHGYLGVQRHGVIELRPALPTPADQLWFWTERWQTREREVDEHVAAGRVAVHDDADAFLTHLDELDAERE